MSKQLLDSQLRWQCRRGMRELDELLLGYLEDHYEKAGETEKVAFRSLLALSDPELVGYLLHKQTPAADFDLVIEHILDRTDS